MKTNKYIQILAIFATLALLLVGASYAADIQGANTTVVQSSTGPTVAATTVNAIGGNVTAVNINGTAITDRWAGFYGNISGVVRLSDSTGNKFYQWTVSQLTGSVVYATNGTVSNWSTLDVATYSNMPSYLQQSAADNYSNTFTSNEAFTTNLRSVAGVDYTYTLNASGQNSQFKTYAMTADVSASANDNSTIVFAGKAVQAANSFNGGAADFQIIAPARTQTTYYFYLELP